MNRSQTYISLVFSIIIFLSIKNARANNLMYIADSMYYRQNYHEALQCYLQVIDKDRFLRQDFSLKFKIAMCYLRSNDFDDARNILMHLKKNNNPLPEYLDYFIFVTFYKQLDKKNIKIFSDIYFKNYPDHFLADSVLYYLADYEFIRKNYRIAYQHYKRLLKNKDYTNERPFILTRIAFCKLYLQERENALEEMYQIMKNYPSSDEALDLARRFKLDAIKDDKFIFAIADVYLKHGEFSLLTEELENYILNISDYNMKEKARFYLLRVYYERGEYRSALYGFKNMLQNLSNKLLESRLRLMIARCYLYLDQKEEAANSYIEYAKLYPRKRLAAETIWKSAWIYEELGDVPQALELYMYILKHWPNSAYRYEAKFRLGLSYYRMKNYALAAEQFNAISQSNWSKFHKYRSLYWLAKTYQEVGLSDKAQSLFINLGTNLFSSYYTLKSYILYREHIDTLLQVKARLTKVKNPLRKYTIHMARLMEKFERLFLIRELFGDNMAFLELSEERYRAQEVEEWVALAEVYKRLGAYNRAFQVYDYIDGKYFSDFEGLDKPFLLKESYPLYYDNLVGDYSKQYNIDENLTLAVIRQESGYNRRAHSRSDAYGLMQIIPRTARQLAQELKLKISGLEKLYNADFNINIGTYYLHKLLNQYDQKMELALAAYNAGPHRVKRWLNITPGKDIDLFVENIEFSETRNYVRLVMRNYWIYYLLHEVN